MYFAVICCIAIAILIAIKIAQVQYRWAKRNGSYAPNGIARPAQTAAAGTTPAAPQVVYAGGGSGWGVAVFFVFLICLGIWWVRVLPTITVRNACADPEIDQVYRCEVSGKTLSSEMHVVAAAGTVARICWKGDVSPVNRSVNSEVFTRWSNATGETVDVTYTAVLNSNKCPVL